MLSCSEYISSDSIQGDDRVDPRFQPEPNQSLTRTITENKYHLKCLPVSGYVDSNRDMQHPMTHFHQGPSLGEYFNALGGHFSDSRPRPIYPFCSNSPLINYILTSQIIIFYTHCQLFSTRNIPYNDVERQYILIIH